MMDGPKETLKSSEIVDDHYTLSGLSNMDPIDNKANFKTLECFLFFKNVKMIAQMTLPAA